MQQHIADYSPVNAPEKNLVQRIADLHPDEQDPAVRQSLIKSEIYLAYRRDLNNLALQERRLRNHQTADLAKLQALQKERQEKNDEKAKIQGRMYQAIRLLAQSKEANIPFDPAQFDFEFSLPEITYCFGVVCDAEAANMPVPSLGKVLAAIRSGKLQVKAPKFHVQQNNAGQRRTRSVLTRRKRAFSRAQRRILWNLNKGRAATPHANRRHLPLNQARQRAHPPHKRFLHRPADPNRRGWRA